MSTLIDKNYNEHYKTKDSPIHVYPVEIVVRTFLETYPGLKMDRSRYLGSKVLDLGYGDGRNFPLFKNLGMKISGIEISEQIVELGKKKFTQLDIPVDLKTGTNSEIPYSDGEFDYVVACNAIYYVGPNQEFEANFNETTRVLKPGGILFATFPKPSSYIFKNAEKLKNGHVKITQDPLGIRNGSVFKYFGSTEEITAYFSSKYRDFSFASCDDNFYGLQQDLWALVCTRK